MPQLQSTANIWSLKMRALWQPCTVVGFKVGEIKCFKRGHFLQCCLPSIHLLRNYPSLISWSSGTVINHTILSLPSCKSGHVTKAWPIRIPMALSPQWICDEHKANQSLNIRCDLLLESRKKMRSFKDFVWLGGLRATFPATQSGAQKEANLEERKSRNSPWEHEFSSYCPMPGFSCT